MTNILPINTGAMDPFFDTVPLSQKLRLLDGTVLHDTAIIKDFFTVSEVQTVWEAVCALPKSPSDKPLEMNFEKPKWVTGKHIASNDDGREIPREKMWFQRNIDNMLRYGYTGWQWAVAAGTYRLGTVPHLEALIDKMDEKLGLEHTLNHWIVTHYASGAHNIPMHSDKVIDWKAGSTFVVIKLGAPRLFVFTQFVDGKDVEIFSEVLEPGTAVIVGYDANQRVKHGVPPVEDSAPSGSIVGWCIETVIPWLDVHKNMAIEEANKAEAKKIKAEAKKIKAEAKKIKAENYMATVEATKAKAKTLKKDTS